VSISRQLSNAAIGEKDRFRMGTIEVSRDIIMAVTNHKKIVGKGAAAWSGHSDCFAE
jgi:hypothetical protein